jgi:hypothetical protein
MMLVPLILACRACCPSRAPLRFEQERHSGLMFARLFVWASGQPSSLALRLDTMWACNKLARLGVHVSPAAHSTRQAHRFEDGPVTTVERRIEQRISRCAGATPCHALTIARRARMLRLCP